jgi:hypothetical protein
MTETIYGCSNCLTSRDRIDETHYSFAWSDGRKIRVTLNGEDVPTEWVVEVKAGEWIIQAVLKDDPTLDHIISVIGVDSSARCDCPDDERGVALMRKVFGPYRVEKVDV